MAPCSTCLATILLHTTLYELRRAGAVIKLEPQVFAVLAYLVQHSDRVASKHELLERLWPDRYVSDKALVRCIQKARRVIGDDSRTPACIQTLHGRGYRFIAKVVQYAQALEETPALSQTAAPWSDTPGRGLSTPRPCSSCPAPS